MKKVLSFLIVAICMFSLYQCTDKDTSLSDENNIDLSTLSNEPDAETVIRKSVDALNNKNPIELNKYISPKKIDSNLRLDNLKNIKIKNIQLSKEPALYNQYKEHFNLKNIHVYLVNCDITYINDTIEPIENGNYDYIYILIKENSEWKILDIGRA